MESTKTEKSQVKLYNKLVKKYNLKDWFRIGAPTGYDTEGNIYSVQTNKSIEGMFELAENKFLYIFEGRRDHGSSNIDGFILDKKLN
jgi:hypothetical protein